MKKLLLFFIVSATFIACKDNQHRKNTGIIQQNLKGKVQTLTEITINLDSSGNAKSDSTFKISEFTTDGYITTVTSKDSSGKIIQIQTLVLNADGTMKEMNKSKEGKQISRFTAEVDKSGNYTSGKNYDSTNNQDSYLADLKTNEYGIVYSGKEYFMNGKIKNTWDAKYEGPNFVGFTATDSLGKTSQGAVKLNEKGDAIKENYSYYEKDSLIAKNYTYKYDSYDDKGNWTLRSTYDEKEKKESIVKRVFAYYKY
jgi:hypothetical protein